MLNSSRFPRPLVSTNFPLDLAHLLYKSVTLLLVILLFTDFIYILPLVKTQLLETSNVNSTIRDASESKPRISLYPQNAVFLEKSSAFIICEVHDSPSGRPTKITWLKDGQSIKKRLPPIKRKNKSILRFDPVKSEDKGVYECQSDVDIGTTLRSQITLKVINELELTEGFPRFISQPIGHQIVEIGGVAIIHCEFQADPRPEIIWLKNSVVLEVPDSSNRITNVGGVLKIHNVTDDDKGDYQCAISNSKGFAVSAFSSLTVSLEPTLERPPTDLKYKLTSPTDVTISWSPPELESKSKEIIGYDIYFGKLGSNNATKLDTPDVTRWAFNDLSENTEYTFRVRAKFKASSGSYSDPIHFMTPKDPPPPPANVRAMANTYSSAMIWWDSTAYFDSIGYRIYYNQYSNQPPQNIDYDKWMVKNVSLTNEVIVSNLVKDATYEVRVCVLGSNSSGRLSNQVRFRVAPLEVPYDLKSSDLTTHSVRISWKPPLDLDSTPVRYKVVYDAPEKHFIDSSGVKKTFTLNQTTLYSNSSSIDIVDLKPYTKYRINVTAVTQIREVFRPPATVHITTAIAAPKPLDEPELIASKGREIELFLPLASEEFGPIGHYYVIVLPTDMPSHDPDSYMTSDLIKSSSKSDHGPYIAAKFSRSKMVKKFILGDNKMYEGFHNRELKPDQQYFVAVRAHVEGIDNLFTSSPAAGPISLNQQRPEIQPSQLSGDSTRRIRWILGVALAIVFVLAIVVTLFYKKQRQALKTNQMNETTIRLLPDQIDRIYSSVPAEPINRRNLSYQSRAMLNHPPVPFSELAEHIDVLRMSNNLKDEYESIEPGQQFTWEHSYMDYNRPKNRYGNVVAYDHSRVILGQIDGVPGSDYINANYCDGYNKPSHYIATQGPLPNTVGDFWRMVWEQKSKTIVMMTQLEERGRVKCVQYWPSRDSVTYHNITITAFKVEELAYYTIRTFRLQYGNQLREVHQFQFTAWPDHGVPNHPTPFLMFLRRIKKTNPADAGPMVVLCSAGVGRTGCFIVIDSMIERIKSESTVDIYSHVTCLRAQRNYIVQTEDQYMFIHDAVLEAVLSADSEIYVSNLTEHLRNLMQVIPSQGVTGLELEFKRLASIKYGGQKFTTANLPVNKHKNRLMNILPYESTRVCLEPIAGIEGSDYINASFCDGYRQRNGYIATQSPLPETVEDLWRMLIEHNSGIIVMLTKLKEMGREKCTQYWPAERCGDYGTYRITLNQEYDTTFNYILREFTITDSRNPNYSKLIRQFHFMNWPEQGVPKSCDAFINFIAEVHKTKQKFGIEGPITVLCSVGVGRTGVFIALSTILERLQNEGYLNLFETVRTLRTQRPAMVQTEDQYQFCYQTALEYIRSFDSR